MDNADRQQQPMDRFWQTLNKVNLPLSFVMNLVALWAIVRGHKSLWLWLTLGVVVSIFGIVTAIHIRRAEKGVGAPSGYDDFDPNQPTFSRTEPRFNPAQRRLASTALITIPTLLLAVAFSYAVWVIVPARQNTILVADFLDQQGQDAYVTRTIVQEIRDELNDQERIRVKRLNRYISDENGEGSETARRIGKQPNHKATIVIWGDYAVVGDDPEIHYHFDILAEETYLDTGFTASYGPAEMAQVERPTIFEFKAPLGEYLGQMVAFTVGLILFESDRNFDAIPLFDIAAKSYGEPLAAEFERPVRFFRGTNYLANGRAANAEDDLKALIFALNGPDFHADSLTFAALGNLGVVAFNQGDYETAKAYYEQALKINTELGNPLGQANLLGNLGLVAFSQGDYEEAKVYHEQALSLHIKLDNILGQAKDMGNLGNVALDQGDYEVAKAYHKQALSLHTELGNLLGQALAQGNLGTVTRNQGDYEEAKAYHEQALSLYIELGNPRGRARGLGNVAFNQGDYKVAKAYYEQALSLHAELDNPLGQAYQLGNLGVVAKNQGDYEAAKAYHEQALKIDTELNNPLGQANHLGNLGVVAKNQGDYEEAKAYYEQALSLHTELGNPLGQANGLGNLGNVAISQGDHEAAKDYYERSAELFRSMGLEVHPAISEALDTLSAVEAQ